jgi:hypothetical protein
MMKTVLLLCVASTVALAQGKSSPAESPARDGGVAMAVTGPIRPPGLAADGGVPSQSAPTPVTVAPTAEVDKLRREVAELKMKALEIESRSQAKVDQLSAQMDKLSKQLDDMQSKINKVSESEDKRVEAEQAEATRRTSTAAASSNLNAALTSLASGNTSGVEQTLRYAESVYQGNALKNVQAARAALSNGDTFAAREHLIMAIIDADGQR